MQCQYSRCIFVVASNAIAICFRNRPLRKAITYSGLILVDINRYKCKRKKSINCKPFDLLNKNALCNNYTTIFIYIYSYVHSNPHHSTSEQFTATAHTPHTSKVRNCFFLRINAYITSLNEFAIGTNCEPHTHRRTHSKQTCGIYIQLRDDKMTCNGSKLV